MSRFVAVALALAALALVVAPSARAQVQSYGTNDNGYFNNILPPGENGFDNALQLAQYEANKTYPPHNNDQDLQNQVNALQSSPSSFPVCSDITNYVAGINAYIKKAETDPRLMPGEYAAIGQPMGPQPFSPTDLIRIATLVGGIFGNGGG